MTEDRRRLDEPPETIVDRLLWRLWGGFGRLLHKLLDSYYDPIDRSPVLLVLFFVAMGSMGLVTGAEGAEELLGFSMASTVLWGVLVYRRGQRWRT